MKRQEQIEVCTATEQELAQVRMAQRSTIEDAAASFARKLTRIMYGACDFVIIVPANKSTQN